MELLNHMMQLFYKGGPVMYLLLACSLFVVTVAIERIFYYRKASAGTEIFRQKLQLLLEKQQFAEAVQLCEHAPQNFIAGVAYAGLTASQRGIQVETALENAAMLSASRLRESLDSLSMIVTLSPLLGLLGTVVGMIQSFSVLNLDSGKPLAITGGVGEALVATATGLVVASLALVLHHIFSRHVNRLITEIEQTGALVISHVYSKKIEWRKSHEIA